MDQPGWGIWAEAIRDILTGLAGAAVLCMACRTPVPRFTPAGEEYAQRKHLSSEIAVYLPPDSPGRPYRVVGTIFVPSMCRIDTTREARLEELRKEAAKAGADGITNVAFLTSDGRMTSVSCGCALPPISRMDSTYTKYEARADAFVWEE